MNLFEYSAMKGKIEQATKVKDLEAIIRTLSDKVFYDDWRHRAKSEHTFTDIKLSYMAFQHAFKRFQEKSKSTLPDFLYNTRIESTKYISKWAIDSSYDLSYDEYIEVFQYTDKIHFSYSYSSSPLSVHNNLKPVINAVGNKSNPYKLNFDRNISTTDPVRATLSYSVRVDYAKTLTSLILTKKLVYNDAPKTILDQLITETAEKCANRMVKLETSINLAEELVIAIKNAEKAIKKAEVESNDTNENEQRTA